MSALLKGFLSENAVAHELIARNFEIYKPVIDIYGSDFVICKNNIFYKVQVKSASQLDNTKYTFNMQYGGDRTAYESDMVDFFIPILNKLMCECVNMYTLKYFINKISPVKVFGI